MDSAHCFAALLPAVFVLLTLWCRSFGSGQRKWKQSAVENPTAPCLDQKSLINIEFTLLAAGTLHS